MLYPRNLEKTLSDELFRNPTSEYRGTPFWAWNGELKEEELLRQIDVFKEMGFGGFHMHVRSGMATEYLSDEFMHLIRSCTDKAKRDKMLSWLYDEDRWPSGAAGGIVTRNEKYRARHLLFAPKDLSGDGQGEIRNRQFLACYDIVLDSEGCLASYDIIEEKAEAKGKKWYVYTEGDIPSGWYNGQTYVDTLNKEAMDKFIEVTHERYKEVVGDEFGKVVPAIFTDEPQFAHKDTLNFAFEEINVVLAWTNDFPETYKKAYGVDIIPHLPELLWELPEGKISTARYHYHDHVTDRFTEAFCDNIGSWCRKNGIALTGHMMEEPSLFSQTHAVGEAMRAYRSFDIPGIDMLCSLKEYTTAKQTQSAVHQFGYEGMLSELYGVTGWHFDFRRHKLNGDWQAALGVTVRVPHLSWYTMKGEAKRDYPAAISYQSAWAEKYNIDEDHFSRVHTALTRGKPDVKVGVIHPIESYWLHWGPTNQTNDVRNQYEENFNNLTEWLLFGLVDFDFISESLLPSQYEKTTENKLKVGKMDYDVIIVPNLETIRSSTLEILNEFKAKGGRLIFMGDAPTLADAVPSNKGKELYNVSEKLPFSKIKLINALSEVRDIDIRYLNGARADSFIYSMRADTDAKWLFIARGKEKSKELFNDWDEAPPYDDIKLEINGNYIPKLYNTLTGEIEEIPFTQENNRTVIFKRMYDEDSLLLKLYEGEGTLAAEGEKATYRNIRIPFVNNYTTSEKNVLMLETAKYSLNGGEIHEEEEILRAYENCYQTIKEDYMKKVSGTNLQDVVNPMDIQPWVYGKAEPTDNCKLIFTVNSEIEVENVLLALENPEYSEIKLNGNKVPMNVVGYYTDKEIKTVNIGTIRKGENIIEVNTKIGISTSLEWYYLLGDFGVKLNGREKILTAKPEKLGFANTYSMLYPFYGANITYEIPFESEGGDIRVRVPHYSGACIIAEIDGVKKDIVFTPCTAEFTKVSKGQHTLKLTLYGHRGNSFGPVHNSQTQYKTMSKPGRWRSKGDKFTYEYRFTELGILTTPIIEEKI